MVQIKVLREQSVLEGQGGRLGNTWFMVDVAWSRCWAIRLGYELFCVLSDVCDYRLLTSSRSQAFGVARNYSVWVWFVFLVGMKGCGGAWVIRLQSVWHVILWTKMNKCVTISFSDLELVSCVLSEGDFLDETYYFVEVSNVYCSISSQSVIKIC